MKILMMILLILLVSAVVLAVLYLLAVMPRMTNRADIRPFLGRLYAHRGLHDNASDAPEIRWRLFEKRWKRDSASSWTCSLPRIWCRWSFTILL